MKLNYTDYVSLLDLRKRGYNLEQESVLDRTHFDNLEDAINDFMFNVVQSIYNLFLSYHSREVTDAFFEDMKSDDLTGKALDFKQRLKLALIEQAIYIYDNGDSNTASYNQERQERSPYAPKAVAELWDILTRNMTLNKSNS